jgi:hypothetical protein
VIPFWGDSEALLQAVRIHEQLRDRNSLIISTHNYPYVTVCPSLQLVDQQIPLTVVAVLGTVLIFSLTPGNTLNCKGDLSYAT